MLTEDFFPLEAELLLYEQISHFLQRKNLLAIQSTAPHLVALVIRKILTSSSYAIQGTLENMIQTRLIEIPNRNGELKAVIWIRIPKSLFIHESPNGYFHRVGSSKRKMPPDLLARLFQQRSMARLIRFDEQIVPNANVQAIDMAH